MKADNGAYGELMSLPLVLIPAFEELPLLQSLLPPISSEQVVLRFRGNRVGSIYENNSPCLDRR